MTVRRPFTEAQEARIRALIADELRQRYIGEASPALIPRADAAGEFAWGETLNDLAWRAAGRKRRKAERRRRWRLDGELARLRDDPRVRKGFRRLFGRDPEPGEI